MVGLRLYCLGLVVIVDAKECADESEDFAKGYEYRGVDFSCGRYDEARYKQTAADDDQRNSADELQGVLLYAPRFPRGFLPSLRGALWGDVCRRKSVIRFHLEWDFMGDFIVSFENCGLHSTFAIPKSHLCTHTNQFNHSTMFQPLYL